MKLTELTPEQLQTELHKVFTDSQIDVAREQLPYLIHTTETMEHLIARIYEVLNVETEEREIHVNKRINRLDTRKDIL